MVSELGLADGIYASAFRFIGASHGLCSVRMEAKLIRSALIGNCDG